MVNFGAKLGECCRPKFWRLRPKICQDVAVAYCLFLPSFVDLKNNPKIDRWRTPT